MISFAAILLVAAGNGAADGLDPGDPRSGYEDPGFRTETRSIDASRGRAADLAKLVESPPLGLPGLDVPEDNPVTPEKIRLGRKLFFDRRLSLNGTISCGMCHIPEQGFTHNELATPLGVEGRSVKRNAPAIYNVGYRPMLFHDGRESSLETQAWTPLLRANEMANPSVGFVLDRVRDLDDYDGAFEAAFGRGPGMETLGMALATYQRTLLSANSAFDRWYYGGDDSAMPAAAKRGFDAFRDSGCSSCHTVGDRSALFTDFGFHDTGLGYAASARPERSIDRITIAPGVTIDVHGQPGVLLPNDLGRYEVTQDPEDRWKFMTPGLRNVALTAPYMHDGSLATLAEVVDHYDRGGIEHDGLDPRIRRLGLSEGEKRDLVAFLESLTGDNVAALAADARHAKIQDF